MNESKLAKQIRDEIEVLENRLSDVNLAFNEGKSTRLSIDEVFDAKGFKSETDEFGYVDLSYTVPNGIDVAIRYDPKIETASSVAATFIHIAFRTGWEKAIKYAAKLF